MEEWLAFGSKLGDLGKKNKLRKQVRVLGILRNLMVFMDSENVISKWQFERPGINEIENAADVSPATETLEAKVKMKK